MMKHHHQRWGESIYRWCCQSLSGVGRKRRCSMLYEKSIVSLIIHFNFIQRST